MAEVVGSVAPLGWWQSALTATEPITLLDARVCHWPNGNGNETSPAGDTLRPGL